MIDRREYRHFYYEQNKARYRRKSKAWYLAHRELTRRRAKERYLEQRENLLRASENRRLAVIYHYSGGRAECACCKESVPVFLAIDHINGRRSDDRRSGGRLYSWLLKHRFPPGFQVLCHNCNFAKWRLGQCPHGSSNTSGKARRS